MKTTQHAMTSVLISGALYAIFRSWELTVGSFLSGVLVDADHIIDYWVVHGLRFDVKQFLFYFDEKNFQNREKLFFILHGWEWLGMLAVVACLTNWNQWITGLMIGYGQHMVLDEFRNNMNFRLRPYFWGYSLLWRWKKGFDFKTSFIRAAASNKNIQHNR
jgi:hypothetical protein